MMPTPHHTAICVFACRWCSLLGAERAGRERLPLPPEIRLMPVSCAGGVSVESVVHAFMNGAAGVAILGCHLGGCRHNDANRDAHIRLEILGNLLETMGIGKDRLCISWGTAHEASQYARLMQDFAYKLSTLPPLPDFFSIPASQAKALEALGDSTKHSFSEPRTDDPTTDEALRLEAAKALDNGRIVLGPARSQSDTIPAIFSSKEELADLVAGPRLLLAKLAGAMLRERARTVKEDFGPYQSLREFAFSCQDRALTIACRACDARALLQMAELHQFPREELEFIPIPCSPAQIERCGCLRHGWPGKDEAPSAENPSACNWLAEFSRCIQCHWCRKVCPVCICPACALDSETALPTAFSAHSSALAYHLTRAMHVADVCVQCGACQDICPQRIPLLRLHQSVAATLGTFGYRSGEGQSSPMRTTRVSIAAPSWFDSRKGGVHA